MDTGIQLDTFALFPQETSDESIQVQLHDIKEIALKVESQASTLIADKTEIERLISFIDLTTLSGNDTRARVENLVEQALSPVLSAPYLSCAAVCVYPARVRDAVLHVKRLGKKLRLNIASVAGGFPSGQYLLLTRQLEIYLAVKDGANEIDSVINRAAALEQNWELVYDEVKQMKRACGMALLKMILATGELENNENIYKASFVSMLAGADFIKTSTGKEAINATLPSAIVMCKAIFRFYQITGKKVGLKVAGGVRTVPDALNYRLVVENILGSEWLTPELFRIGASNLLDNIVKALSLNNNC